MNNGQDSNHSNLDMGGGQAAYKETPYRPESWEVIGECDLASQFQPMELEVVAGGKYSTDPMFADYGGSTKVKSTLRYHVPEGAEELYRSEENGEEEATVERISLTEEELAALKAEAAEVGRQAAAAELQGIERQRWEALEKRFGETVNDLVAQTKRYLETIERSAVDLSLEIAGKLIGQAVEINPEYIVDLVNKAISKAGGAAIKTVRVSPEDMEFIEVVGIAKKIKEYDGTWKFESDPGVKAGCIVETTAGEIDFQLDAAWERIKEQVLKVL